MADDAARRRELRRRRILENADERKRRIFGISKGSEDASENNEENNSPVNTEEVSRNATSTTEEKYNSVPVVENARTSLTPEIEKTQKLNKSDSTGNVDNDILSRPVLNNDILSRPVPNLRVENGIGSVPDFTEQLRNLNNIITAGGNSPPGFTSQQSRILDNDVQSSAQVGSLSSPFVPIIVALFVCIVLSVNLGYVVSNSIALPFFLFEAHRLWCSRHLIDAMSKGVGGLLGLALVLCGINQEVISKMTRMMTAMKCVFEDFAFYITTIVFWYCMIGLPRAVQEEPDNNISEPTILMEDSFNDM